MLECEKQSNCEFENIMQEIPSLPLDEYQVFENRYNEILSFFSKFSEEQEDFFKKEGYFGIQRFEEIRIVKRKDQCFKLTDRVKNYDKLISLFSSKMCPGYIIDWVMDFNEECIYIGVYKDKNFSVDSSLEKPIEYNSKVSELLYGEEYDYNSNFKQDGFYGNLRNQKYESYKHPYKNLYENYESSNIIPLREENREFYRDCAQKDFWKEFMRKQFHRKKYRKSGYLQEYDLNSTVEGDNIEQYDPFYDYRTL